ncbi:glycoside hydrolase family 2 TIM barrel-domain containing protein [Chitinophaga solisilvae]|uniref:glycoside hydrolase family 2 TIM barrel-domain containing protein n=1 Tax=Chitinophaga solisilvae TaxID=1233460 RepID=UPI001371CE82|nr:glycoside hydrolase family 2 TIM barrel-domain containing protein [Chitinophaga solisilvae]
MKKNILTLIYTLLFTAAMAQTQRLSPRPEEVISLNGSWTFQHRYPIQVPGEWVMQGFTVSEGETAVYTRPLNIPAAWKGRRIKIRFDAVSSHARVKVNGIQTGEHEGGFVPFETDITSALNGKADTLTVEVQALTISDYLACTSQYAVHTVGGLIRKVSMYALPEVNLSDISLHTTFDALYKNATLHIAATIANESTMPANAALRFTLRDAAGKTVLQSSAGIMGKIAAGGQSAGNYQFSIRTPRHWTPETPYLYQLQVELLQQGKITETTISTVGFRQVNIQGNELLVNGKAVKLRGVNRHDVHPLTGRSIAAPLNRRDALLFRDANCNYIRTSHYPPSEEFLEAADELGLFVESEAALTWIQHGASPIWKLWDYKDEKFLPYMIQANADNIRAGRNHPSVIIWSLGNESLWSPLWEKVLAFVKKTDPSRPTTFHDQCWGGFNNAGSKADIAVYHYPGINGPAKAATSGRPVLFGEYAHLSCYNRRELATDPGIRSAYNAPLITFYDSVYHYKGCLGGAIWSGIDDIFHLPGGQIAGYGPWGPVDAWRRPKPEYTGMKKAYAPVKILQVQETNDYLQLTIQNRYDFTSLKDVKITANGQLLHAAIPAGATGTLRIPKKEHAPVHITFTDPRGFICAEEITGAATVMPVPRPVYALHYTENNGAVFIRQGPYSYTISKTKGIITCLRKGQDTLLQQGPVFSVVPANDDDGGKPNVAGETYQQNIYPLKNYPLYTIFAKDIKTTQSDAGIRIDMHVTYTSGSGRQSYLITPAGELITEYAVHYTGHDTLPYQYGLLLQLPVRFNHLSWKRTGALSVSDTTDIGRSSGTAMLHATQLNAVEPFGVQPSGLWKDDANELGSNDFRSTKHTILQAALSDKTGNTVQAVSDGRQHSRSWLQDGAVQWLLADYSNNGSEPFYGSPHSNGKINIRNKTLQGKLIVQLP